MKWNDKKLAITIHVLGWLLLYSFPLLMRMNFPGEISWQMELRNALHFALLVLVFYVNYLWLIPRLLFKKKFIPYGASIFTMVITVILANSLLNGTLQRNRNFRQFKAPMQDSTSRLVTPRAFKARSGDSVIVLPSPQKGPPIPFDIVAGLSALFVLFLGMGIRFGQQWFANERQKEEIEKEKLQTELSLLKSQINPHFFFNMLNNIYSLISSDPPKAQPSRLFMRVHRSYIVNLSKIEAVERHLIHFSVGEARFSEQYGDKFLKRIHSYP